MTEEWKSPTVHSKVPERRPGFVAAAAAAVTPVVFADAVVVVAVTAVVDGGDAGKYAVVVVDVLAVVAVAAVVMSVGHLVGKAESVAVSVGVVGIENLVSGGKRNAPI